MVDPVPLLLRPDGVLGWRAAGHHPAARADDAVTRRLVFRVKRQGIGAAVPIARRLSQRTCHDFGQSGPTDRSRNSACRRPSPQQEVAKPGQRKCCHNSSVLRPLPRVHGTVRQGLPTPRMKPTTWMSRCLGRPTFLPSTALLSWSMLCAPRANERPSCSPRRNGRERRGACRTGAPGSPELLSSWIALAEVLRESGKYAEAEQLYRRALASGTRYLGADNPIVAFNELRYAKPLHATGRNGEVESMLTHASMIAYATGNRRCSGRSRVN